MEKKTLIVLALVAVTILACYLYYRPLAVVTQTLTGTVTLAPCPLDESVQVYALQTQTELCYFTRSGGGYFNKGCIPWLQQHEGATVTVTGEAYTFLGKKHLRSWKPL